MISYAGVDLSLWTPKAAAWAERHISLDRIFPPQNDWNPPAVDLPWPKPYTPPAIRINTYTCPIGLSRWGTFYGIVDPTQLAAIRARVKAFSPAITNVPVDTLTLSDGRPASRVKARMTLLNVTPLSGIAGELSLITLVDPRYGYNQDLTPSFFCNGYSFSWFSLISQVYRGGLSGSDPEIDYNGDGLYDGSSGIQSAYGFPSSKWNAASRFSTRGATLDAIANALNMRWVFDPYEGPVSGGFSGGPMAGRCILVGSGKIGSTGKVSTEHTYNFPAETDSVCMVTPPTETVLPDDAGNSFGWGFGLFESNAGRQNLMCTRLAGTREDAADVKMLVPENITVASVNSPQVSTTLNKNTVVTLSQVNAAGFAVELLGGGSFYIAGPVLQVDRSDITTAEATTIAGDHYGWYRADADVTWQGIVRPRFTGFCWGIEWYHGSGLVTTRYIRHPRDMRLLGNNPSEMSVYNPQRKTEVVKILGPTLGPTEGVDWYLCISPSSGTGHVRSNQPGVEINTHLESQQEYYAVRTVPRADGTPQWIATGLVTTALWLPKTLAVDQKILVQGSGTGLDPYYISFSAGALGTYRVLNTDTVLP